MMAVFAGTVITSVVLASLLSRSGIIADTGSDASSPAVDTSSHVAGGQATGEDTGSGSMQSENFSPADGTLPDMRNNVTMEASMIEDGGGAKPVACRKVDRKNHKSLSEYHLLNKLRYGVGSDVYELSLVQSLADNSHWKGVAVKLGMTPATILDNYRETKEELMESSRRLFDKIYERGYNGAFDWDAYIAGFTKTGGLEGIIDDLGNMLTCLSISRTRSEAVTRDRLYHMTCDKDETVLNLIEEVAPHWRRVAKTFKIKEHFIFADRNIPELSATTVLRRLYDSGYKGELGWQGVLDVLRETELEKIYGTLDRALNCVVD